MNETIRLKGVAWPGEALAPEAKAEHLRLAETRVEEMRRYGRSYRRMGFFVGTAGLLVGLAGIALAASLLPLKQTVVRFAVVNETTGEVGESIGPADAPRLFSEGTARQYLRMFVEACDGYLWETRVLNAHRCALLMTAEQQARYAEWFSPRNPDSPQVVFGRNGSVRPDQFRFTRLGDARGDTQAWQVRYVRLEMKDGRAARRPWMMTVQFQWRPQLAMSDNDRTLNLAGFQALDYVSQPDPAQ